MSKPIYLHEKSNTQYELLAFGLNESDCMPMVVYRNLDDNLVWIRSSKDFFDGRFKLVHGGKM